MHSVAWCAGCLYRAFAQLTPAVVKDYRDMALTLLHPGHTVIGLHRRMGDRTMHELENYTQDWEDEFWKCAGFHIER